MEVNLDKEWLEFSKNIFERDNNCCVQCTRHRNNIRLYVYPSSLHSSHCVEQTTFEECQGKELIMSDYISLCSACITINKFYKNNKELKND